MSQKLQTLSVIDVAEVCGVARSTVYYWIARKYLPAHRSGSKQMVFVNDLVLFLKSQGFRVPQNLLKQIGGIYSQPFRSFKKCWEYWANEPHGTKCRDCNVFTFQINECFVAKNNQNKKRKVNCHKCQYFGEYYSPGLAFIHQLEKPAGVLKDLDMWSGNKAWAELCSVEIVSLIGVGIEEFIHPDSLKELIGFNKMLNQKDPALPDKLRVILISQNKVKIPVYLNIISLTVPAGTWLAVVERK